MTAIIVTYRGLDTLGEVTVLFLTAAIVGLVLERGRRRAASRRPSNSSALLRRSSSNRAYSISEPRPSARLRGGGLEQTPQQAHAVHPVVHPRDVVGRR